MTDMINSNPDHETVDRTEGRTNHPIHLGLLDTVDQITLFDLFDRFDQGCRGGDGDE